MVSETQPTILVLGASGLIGHALASRLRRAGYPVVGVARRFSLAQKAALEGHVREADILRLDASGLENLFSRHGADIVVNCIGVLQDSSRRGSAADAHSGLVGRLAEAMALEGAAPRLLVHLSIPGRPEEDKTQFSRTKRDADGILAASGAAHVVLRPGFVIAPAAYGGSALIRALAALPLDLPRHESSRPFATTDVNDIVRTVCHVARRWREGERVWRTVWDVMEETPTTVGAVIDAFRVHLGGPRRRLRLPAWLMRLGASAGDIAAGLGWSPPIRSTALAEMRRGVSGDPRRWMAETGIEPSSLGQTLARLDATVQESWFARLYLAKPAVIGGLAAFWTVSGVIALTVGFEAAASILVGAGVPARLAQATTAVTSLADIAVGAAIAYRPTCRVGLMAGIALSLAYMAGAVVLTPGLWLDPLGPLVKTGPAILLMAVALAIMDER
ncbi:SDR family oxidoreductase [Mesorhizobium sp. CAU 1741]|uniref:SDR family oxidoreductase n=1 Tax=Mesorhizobium sp. CAU 1741 TaxID=3140366 RepID=UPI00325B1B4A